MAPRQTAALRDATHRADTREGAADAIDFGPFGDWLGFHLRMAQIASFQSFARHTHEIGLSPGRFAALILIDRNPGITQTAISRAIGSDKSTLTPMLDSLVKRGLITRMRTAADRRLYELALTPEGKKVMRAMLVRAQRHEAALDAVVGPREREQFLNTLKRLTAALGGG